MIRQTKPKVSLRIFFLALSKYLYIYTYIGRVLGRGKEKEKGLCESETSIDCLLHAPHQGQNPPPAHVPWSGIKLTTFPCRGWATLGRANQVILNANKTWCMKIFIQIILIIVTLWKHNSQQWSWQSKLWHSYTMECPPLCSVFLVICSLRVLY